MIATSLADRAVLRLSGEEVREFLQGLVTQDMAAVQPGAPQWSALLTAQGKVLFDFLLWADGGDILIDCEADAADDLIKRLMLYRLRRPIEIERDGALAVHWCAPAKTGAQARTDGTGLLPSQEHTPDPRLAALGHRWLAPRGDGDASPDWRAHRLSLGVPEGANELGSDKTLWLECNAEELNGVSYEKGCYVGQENTARMHYRNKVNRRLVIVPLDQADAKRQRITYPDLDLSVEHRRVDDIDAAKAPDWLTTALKNNN